MSTATDVSDAIVKSLICDVAVEALESQALVLAPWLGLPVIHSVEHFVLEQIADKICEQLSLDADFKIIDIQVQGQKNDYQDALAKFKAVNAQGDQDAIDKAKADLKKRLADLIRVKP